MFKILRHLMRCKLCSMRVHLNPVRMSSDANALWINRPDNCSHIPSRRIIESVVCGVETEGHHQMELKKKKDRKKRKCLLFFFACDAGPWHGWQHLFPFYWETLKCLVTITRKKTNNEVYNDFRPGYYTANPLYVKRECKIVLAVLLNPEEKKNPPPLFLFTWK